MLNAAHLGKIYKDIYISINKEDTSVINSIIEFEKIFNKHCIEWDKKNLVQWLKECKSTSIGSLNVRISLFRKFCIYICEKEHVAYKEIGFDFGEAYHYLDIDTIKRTTLTYQDYRSLLNQMLSDDSGLGWNVRDRLIFELAWVGLSNEEIKLLKESDIEFQGEDAVLIKIGENKFFRSEDEQLIKDIRAGLQEQYHYIYSKDNKRKRMQYRDSEYLIKPVNVGRGKKEDYVSNPSLILQAILISSEITCEGIDVFNLSIEDIRRSKIVYMLADENKEYFDMGFVQNMFDLSSENQMFWYKKVARIKYENIL